MADTNEPEMNDTDTPRKTRGFWEGVLIMTVICAAAGLLGALADIKLERKRLEDEFWNR